MNKTVHELGLFDHLLPPPPRQSGKARDLQLLLNTRGRILPPDDPQADDTTGEAFGTLAPDLPNVTDARDLAKLARQIKDQLGQWASWLLAATVTVGEDRSIRITGVVKVPKKKTTGVSVEERAVAFVAVRGNDLYTVREVAA